MAGLKRKDGPKATTTQTKKAKRSPVVPVGADLPESDTTEDSADNFDGFGAGDDTGDSSLSEEDNTKVKSKTSEHQPQANRDGEKKGKGSTTSAEAHATQRALARERKANKPNADSIARSKKIWERLRRKSHVPLDERKQLVSELFDIISGRVRDFVFKHDSVRVIQCALKYANKEQRKIIVQELQADIRPLAESKYGKFLVGKMVTEGDEEIRAMVIPQFYGQIRRLINHPEAAWLIDDIYRQVASPLQKATILREWYGAEFALLNNPKHLGDKDGSKKADADLSKILAENPEKRKPIMQYLLQIIKSLVDKEKSGFTMLHDAMLQYYLNVPAGSEEHTEFIELLKSDMEESTDKEKEKDKSGSITGGDLLKNLAFTKSGSRVVCLALAYGTAKDRRNILRAYKDTIELMALDNNAHMVLVAFMDVTDDTRMIGKSIISELIGSDAQDEAVKEERLQGLVNHLSARVPLLYPLASVEAKWLLNDDQKTILQEVHEIRKSTSKKDAETRRRELIALLSPALISLVEHNAQDLASSSFGCQAITEILLECAGEKGAACAAVAELAAPSVLLATSDASTTANTITKLDGADTATEQEPTGQHISDTFSGGRMLRTLVQGGKFSPKTKDIIPVEPALDFGNHLYPVLKDHIMDWACGPSSFVVVALVESAQTSPTIKESILGTLRTGKKQLESVAGAGGKKAKDAKVKKGEKGEKEKEKDKGREKGNAGARILLEKLR